METQEYNHDQPHLTVHESKVDYNGDDRQRRRVTMFLCAYQMHRCYGGPEEGGWWYDAWEFTGAAFPFSCEQEFEKRWWDHDEYGNPNSNENVERFGLVDYDDDEGKFFTWQPVGLPHVTDEPTRVRLESVRMHYIDMFGDPDREQYRYSMRPRGEDFDFVYELTPGARGNQPRPRYC